MVAAGSVEMAVDCMKRGAYDFLTKPFSEADLMRAIRSREIRLVEVDTAIPSPFASSLLFDYIATYMYEGDAPAAERRAQALQLDRALLAELDSPVDHADSQAMNALKERTPNSEAMRGISSIWASRTMMA